jgi:hypothetical protein
VYINVTTNTLEGEAMSAQLLRLLLGVILVVEHTINENIVMRVTIIRDQSASIVVAGEFDLGCIDLVNISNVSLAIGLEHCLVIADSGGRELRVD